jgi:hypothetical protein
VHVRKFYAGLTQFCFVDVNVCAHALKITLDPIALILLSIRHIQRPRFILSMVNLRYVHPFKKNIYSVNSAVVISLKPVESNSLALLCS